MEIVAQRQAQPFCAAGCFGVPDFFRRRGRGCEGQPYWLGLDRLIAHFRAGGDAQDCGSRRAKATRPWICGPWLPGHRSSAGAAASRLEGRNYSSIKIPRSCCLEWSLTVRPATAGLIMGDILLETGASVLSDAEALAGVLDNATIGESLNFRVLARWSRPRSEGPDRRAAEKGEVARKGEVKCWAMPLEKSRRGSAGSPCRCSRAEVVAGRAWCGAGTDEW